MAIADLVQSCELMLSLGMACSGSHTLDMRMSLVCWTQSSSSRDLAMDLREGRFLIVRQNRCGHSKVKFGAHKGARTTVAQQPFQSARLPDATLAIRKDSPLRCFCRGL